MVFGKNDPEGAISISTEDGLAEISKENEFKRGVALLALRPKHSIQNRSESDFRTIWVKERQWITEK